MNLSLKSSFVKKNGIKKYKNANPLKHRLSDAKWRSNLNNSFTALKTIIGIKGKTSKKGSVKQLSRIEVLKSTIDFIEEKESVIRELTPHKDMNCNNDNGLQQIKHVFDLFETNSFDDLKKMNLKFDFKRMTNENQIDISKTQLVPKYDVMSEKPLNCQSFSNNDDKEVNMASDYSYSSCEQSSETNDPFSHYSSPSINRFDSYQTYSVQMPEESDFFRSYLNDKIQRNDCLTTDLSDYLSNNIPLTTINSLTYLTDASSGSHSQEFTSLLTPIKNLGYFNEDMTSKKKKISLSSESRPINCRRRLDWTQTDDSWPGIMNLTIDSNASGDGMLVCKAELNPQITSSVESQSCGDGLLSKDLENINVKDMNISQSNFEQCLKTLNTKEDFEFNAKVLNVDQIQGNHSLNRIMGEEVESDELDNEELLDFMNSNGKYSAIITETDQK